MTLSKGAGLAHYIRGIADYLPDSINAVMITHKDTDTGKHKAVNPMFYNIFTRLLYEHFIFPSYARKMNCSCMFIPKSYAPLYRPVKVVSAMHDLIPAGHDSGESIFHRVYWKIQFYCALRFSHGIIFNTDLLKKQVHKQYVFTKMKKNIVCHYGYDSFKIRQLRGNKHFLIPATIKKRKNTRLALQLALRLCEISGKRDIIITGRMENREILEIIKKHDNIIYEGYVDDRRMEILYNDAYAVIFLSAMEGFSLPVAESVFLTKTVIASDIEIHRHLYGDYPVYYNLDLSLDENVIAVNEKLKERRTETETKSRTWTEAAGETAEFFITICR